MNPDDTIATQHEAATLLRLRDKSGWWVGDRRALKVLREFAAFVRLDAVNDVASTINSNPGREGSAEQVRASEAA